MSDMPPKFQSEKIKLKPGKDGHHTFKTYRGTSKEGHPNDYGALGKGEYSTPHKHVAASYADGDESRVKEHTVKLKNPLVGTYGELTAFQKKHFGGMVTGFDKEQSHKFDAWMRHHGHDGAVAYEEEDHKTPAEVVKLGDHKGDGREPKWAKDKKDESMKAHDELKKNYKNHQELIDAAGEVGVHADDGASHHDIVNAAEEAGVKAKPKLTKKVIDAVADKAGKLVADAVFGGKSRKVKEDLTRGDLMEARLSEGKEYLGADGSWSEEAHHARLFASEIEAKQAAIDPSKHKIGKLKDEDGSEKHCVYREGK